MKPAELLKLAERVRFPLPYFDYAEDDGIHLLADGGLGFAFECSPRYGGTTVSSGLTSAMEILPEGYSVQVILWASPNVEPLVNRWKKRKRIKDGLYGEIAENYAEFAASAAYESMSVNIPASVRNYRVMITVKAGGKGEPVSIFDVKPKKGVKPRQELMQKFADLRGIRSRFMGALKAAYLNPVQVDANRLIGWCHEILNQNHLQDEAHVPVWDGTDISDFCVQNDTAINVYDQHMTVDGICAKSLSVQNYPETWSLWLSDAFSGNPLTGVAFETPFIICMNAWKMPKDKTGSLKRNAHLVMGQKLSYALFPRMKHKHEDLGYGLDRIEKGEALWHMNLSIMVFGKDPDVLGTVTGQVQSYYNSLGFRIQEDRYIHAPILLSCLPFGWDETMRDVLRRGRVVFTDNVVDFCPVSADWGGTSPEVLLFTPRGQLFGFDLFADEQGGFNAFCIGTTGAGKSVLLQLVALSYLMSSDRTFILDIGGSYKRFCNAFGGEYIEIDKDDPICLNPWSDIENDAMFGEYFEFLTDWYFMLGAPAERTLSDQLEKLVKSHIGEALQRSWRNHGADSCVDTVIEELKTRQSDPRIADFIQTMKPYSTEGAYGAFFNGRSNVDFQSRLTVLENGTLETIPHLRDPIIMVLTFHISKSIYLADQDYRHLVLIDEAHKFLGNPKIDVFIEQAYRRFRKHGAAMVLGTQGFEDLYGGETISRAGRAIVQNSAYRMFMLQSSTSREKVKSAGYFGLDNREESLMDSVHPVQGEFSEVFIMGEKSREKVRIVLDPFLKTLFFTNKELRVKINRLVESGMSWTEAVKTVQKEMS